MWVNWQRMVIHIVEMETVVGRDARVAGFLEHGSASRRHAMIRRSESGWLVSDLGSTNGTYHNGRRVAVSKLQSGDTIGCGKTVMKLQVSR